MNNSFFISSTYDDLNKERSKIIYGLQELDVNYLEVNDFNYSHDQIYNQINNKLPKCNIMLLIIGQKYGNTNSSGIGYSEIEYNIAIENKLSIIPFLINEENSNLVKKSEKINKQKSLKKFRNNIIKNHSKDISYFYHDKLSIDIIVQLFKRNLL